MASGVSIYLYDVTVYWSLSVLDFFKYVCMCDIKSEYHRKRHYLSDVNNP